MGETPALYNDFLFSSKMYIWKLQHEKIRRVDFGGSKFNPWFRVSETTGRTFWR